LQNTEEVLDCLRGCNVAARWLMLHATGRHPRLGPAVAERLPPPAAVVAFVMDTALLEFEVRFGHGKLLRTKRQSPQNSCRTVASSYPHVEQPGSAFAHPLCCTKR
jgi:Hereditary spastic paraplegia protein strumpellin